MNTTTSYILKDLSGNIWAFILDENSHLLCNNSYEITQIDENVLEFDVNINYLGVIQLIYITYDGHIKYCQFNKKWDTEILYTLSHNGDKIKDINLFSVDDEIHIFFLYKEKNDENIYSLLHYKWCGKKFDTNVICYMKPLVYASKNYYVEPYNNKLCIIFISEENHDVVLNLCEYNNNSWKTPYKLYRVNGDNLYFFTIKHNNLIHILNLSRERDLYFLEHVTIDNKLNMSNFKIYENSQEIQTPIFLIQNKTLYSMWLENTELKYSLFNNGWGKIKTLPIDKKEKITNFRYACEENPWDNLKAKSIFALSSPKFKMLLPQKIIYYENNNKNLYNIKIENPKENNAVQELLKELSYNKMMKTNLEKRINILKNKISDKNISINKYNEYLNKLMVQKRDVENSYNTLLHSQKSYINEIETLKNKVELLYKENHLLKEKGTKVKEFESNLDQQKETLQNMYIKVKELELELKEKERENIDIKKELEFEKNKSFIEKLFKG